MTPEQRDQVSRRITHAIVADDGANRAYKPNMTGGADDYRLAVELGRRFGATDTELTELGVPEQYLKEPACPTPPTQASPSPATGRKPKGRSKS